MTNNRFLVLFTKNSTFSGRDKLINFELSSNSARPNNNISPSFNGTAVINSSNEQIFFNNFTDTFRSIFLSAVKQLHICVII